MIDHDHDHDHDHDPNQDRRMRLFRQRLSLIRSMGGGNSKGRKPYLAERPDTAKATRCFGDELRERKAREGMCGDGAGADIPGKPSDYGQFIETWAERKARQTAERKSKTPTKTAAPPLRPPLEPPYRCLPFNGLERWKIVKFNKAQKGLS